MGRAGSFGWAECVQLAVVATALKLLLVPTYRSTDFEVHRNWLAITHSLPLSQWYLDATSEWTLDYPPLFAWFEWALAQLAARVEPGMVVLTNLGYDSDAAVLFQRFSVMATDAVLLLAAYLLARGVGAAPFSPRAGASAASAGCCLFLLLATCAGLLLVDHVHFQYNGVLMGVLLLSLAAGRSGAPLLSGVLFAALLMLKHLFAYAGPVYFVLLLRHYCFGGEGEEAAEAAAAASGAEAQAGGRGKGRGGAGWFGRGLVRLAVLGCGVVAVFAAALGPFLALGQGKQLLSRLFPFGRGLLHAYWAANAWALYAAADKAAAAVLPRLAARGVPGLGWAAGLAEAGAGANLAGGLVGVSRFTVLPQVPPSATALAVLAALAPCLLALWAGDGRPRFLRRSLARAVGYALLCGFVWGYHVHEKAVLVALLPLALDAVSDRTAARRFLLLSAAGHYGLLPLLFRPQEYGVKIVLVLSYLAVTGAALSALHGRTPSAGGGGASEAAGGGSTPGQGRRQRRGRAGTGLLSRLEWAYVLGFAGVEAACGVLQASALGQRLPFAPLMLTSCYCAVGVVGVWGEMAVEWCREAAAGWKAISYLARKHKGVDVKNIFYSSTRCCSPAGSDNRGRLILRAYACAVRDCSDDPVARASALRRAKALHMTPAELEEDARKAEAARHRGMQQDGQQAAANEAVEDGRDAAQSPQANASDVCAAAASSAATPVAAASEAGCGGALPSAGDAGGIEHDSGGGVFGWPAARTSSAALAGAADSMDLDPSGCFQHGCFQQPTPTKRPASAAAGTSSATPGPLPLQAAAGNSSCSHSVCGTPAAAAAAAATTAFAAQRGAAATSTGGGAGDEACDGQWAPLLDLLDTCIDGMDHDLLDLTDKYDEYDNRTPCRAPQAPPPLLMDPPAAVRLLAPPRPHALLLPPPPRQQHSMVTGSLPAYASYARAGSSMGFRPACAPSPPAYQMLPQPVTAAGPPLLPPPPVHQAACGIAPQADPTAVEAPCASRMQPGVTRIAPLGASAPATGGDGTAPTARPDNPPLLPPLPTPQPQTPLHLQPPPRAVGSAAAVTTGPLRSHNSLPLPRLVGTASLPQSHSLRRSHTLRAPVDPHPAPHDQHPEPQPRRWPSLLDRFAPPAELASLVTCPSLPAAAAQPSNTRPYSTGNVALPYGGSGNLGLYGLGTAGATAASGSGFVPGRPLSGCLGLPSALPLAAPLSAPLPLLPSQSPALAAPAMALRSAVQAAGLLVAPAAGAHGFDVWGAMMPMGSGPLLHVGYDSTEVVTMGYDDDVWNSILMQG
ncbi:hypothetical protein HYH03_008373 [Edaphochlamys debaryana]|uniref:dolichyl-P-Glc:Glc1Man9GlcNAc2-PP-dolichol alpha-1,3-glucosyltransferase n=1 Tax=Edaphochlamys debaryana TaxID=47281 RepID=A0A835Y1H5_9CHLO|nr:hypothetical protein HYH03_008373 [Edaphochlamys debaryana]|eukprot:KAG2493559.1 hypothetical protein HYH03_008373 [Edaphochlamys debaryana]